MARLTWTPSARLDLDDIAFFIGVENHSPLAAERFIDKIQDESSHYARQPELGERQPKVGDTLRAFPVGEYVVFYRPIDDGIEIIRVLHGRRDLASLSCEELPDR